ncbi:MAG TPA: glutamine synthetase family protein [Propionibacteriaceae bacterium]|nr:glutamine synthetase family protein [Propionibacteriaceae bacterium]
MDVAERQARSAHAERLVRTLVEHDVGMVATTFVDNAGITRVKSVPLKRLPELAAWGVGASTSFDFFRFDDWLAAPPDGTAPVGDLRVIPDLRRLVRLAAQPGWAWAPGDRYRQDGKPHERCSRLLLQRLVNDAAGAGLAIKAAIEIEWVVSAGDGEDFVSAAVGPAYGMSRLVGVSDYVRDVIDALSAERIRVDQFHPEYAAGQLELSVAAESPVDAADTEVLVRSTIRAVGRRYNYRTSFSPKVEAEGVGNGGHVHLSVWRGGQNMMSGGDGRCGLTPVGEAFAAGILNRLPALLAIGAPSVASYLRLVPSHWAGVYASWGLENRETALRMITGSAGSSAWAANIEVKCLDLTANPYLLLAGLLAAWLNGVASEAQLPEAVDVDPAVLAPDELDRRGIQRLPVTLRESTDALAADTELREALGSALIDSVLAVRESEIELFAGASAEEVVRAFRWMH